jgi:hypothetical protein
MTASSVDLSARALRNFLVKEIAPLLGPQFQLHGRRALVRMRGPVVQSLVLSASRSRVLVVWPCLFLCGANPSVPALDASLSLTILDRSKWSFVDPRLSGSLAKRIASMLNDKVVPLDFSSDLMDATIEETVSAFIAQLDFWSDCLFLAFFNAFRGVRTAREDLNRAKQKFVAQAASPYREHEVALLERFENLASRFDRQDCIALCRGDADGHARRLKLPPISWPPEWPTAVVNWLPARTEFR